MKRWAICRLDDFENEGGGTRTFKFSLYPNVNVRGWSKDGFNWAFCQIASADVARFGADPDIYILPDGVMDMAVGSIPAGVRTTMRNRLEAAGFTFGEVKTTWTIRQLLVYIMRQIQPALSSVEVGDVPDIEQ